MSQDGDTSPACVDGYSRADDATFYCFSGDPFLRFVVSSFVTETFAPVGTEIWLIDVVDFDG